MNSPKWSHYLKCECNLSPLCLNSDSQFSLLCTWGLFAHPCSSFMPFFVHPTYLLKLRALPQRRSLKCTTRRSVYGVQKQDWSRKWQSSSPPPTAQRSKQHNKLVRTTARIKTKQIWSKKDSIVHCLQLCKETHSTTPCKAIPWESLQATKHNNF
jgi:hypothetical protein